MMRRSFVIGLNEHSSVPLYEQLADILRDNIRNGLLKPGDPIPTEMELAEKFDVSRTTARQAVLALVREGLVYRKQGKGSFVSRPKIVQSLVMLRSFSEDIRILGFEPGVVLLGYQDAHADPVAAEALEISDGDPVLEVTRLRLADNEEVSINRSYFPEPYASIMRESHLGSQCFGAPSLWEVIEEQLGPIIGAKQLISASSAPPEDARILQVPPGTALLRLERVTYLSGRKPVEFVRADLRPDRYTFFIELKR
ncbi:MAG: GntR family transcriptional regulator [Bacillota bacterium]